MVFPYEKAAANGDPMPDGLPLVDQVAFRFLRSMYRDIRTGIQTREQAIEEKGKMTCQYDKEKQSMEHWKTMGEYWSEMHRNLESAQSAYRKNRTLENADALSAALDGRL